MLEITELRLNYTLDLCSEVLGSQFYRGESIYVKKFHWPITHGSEFYGVQYFLVYLPHMERNMYTLLSTFSLLGWLLIFGNFCLLALVLFLFGAKHNSIFWMFAVIIEQGDDKYCFTVNVVICCTYTTKYVHLSFIYIRT